MLPVQEISRPMLALGTEGWVQSISWSDGNLNKALVSLALVLHMLVVFIDYVLVFFVLSLAG